LQAVETVALCFVQAHGNCRLLLDRCNVTTVRLSYRLQPWPT